ncbi:hypothetical protein OAM01_02300 [bacterium]|nr:hypothetical protein [bacterium]
MSKKHLIIIHGRASKPSHEEKERLVKKSLLHGLDRVDTSASKAIRNRKVKYDFVYYGDLNNRLILDAMDKKDPKRKEYTGRDARHGNQKCQPNGSYDADLEDLFAQQSFTKNAYKRFLKEHPDKRGLDDIAAVVSWFANLVALSDNIVKGATPDMGAYLMSRREGSKIRTRLQDPLKKSLLAGNDVCLVAHSMGCIVSYDVLWKFSQMSEYRNIKESGNKVSQWITLGNPLGEPGVRKNLYDAKEGEDGKYPRHIIKDWVNIAAKDDFVSHDEDIRDDFKPMLKKGYVESITDIHRGIYTFWKGQDGTNPHKLYGYLDNPKVAQQISKWISS